MSHDGLAARVNRLGVRDGLGLLYDHASVRRWIRDGNSSGQSWSFPRVTIVVMMLLTVERTRVIGSPAYVVSNECF